MLLPMPLPQTTEWLCPRRSPSVGYREIQCNITLFIVPPWKGKPIINFLETKKPFLLLSKLPYRFDLLLRLSCSTDMIIFENHTKSLIFNTLWSKIFEFHIRISTILLGAKIHIFKKLYKSYFCA